MFMVSFWGAAVSSTLRKQEDTQLSRCLALLVLEEPREVVRRSSLGRLLDQLLHLHTHGDWASGLNTLKLC